MDDRLAELLELAADLTALKDAEEENRASGQWKAAKQQFEGLQEKFDEVRKAYIDQLLCADEDTSAAAQRVNAQLTDVRATCNPSWHPAVDYTSENLVPHIRKEAAKSPLRRKATKAFPYALGAIVVLAFFGTRVVQVSDITASYETRVGLEQRAAAVSKVLRYDDWMGTHVRRGGWLKGIMLWPIEPSDEEISGAAEFVSITLVAQGIAETDFGCPTLTQGYDAELSDQQLDFVSAVAERVVEDQTWQDPPARTVVDAARSVGNC